MRVELRQQTNPGTLVIEPRGIVLISESKEESLLMDEVFGNNVGDDGLISTKECECRLSDGYGEHYIYVKVK